MIGKPLKKNKYNARKTEYKGRKYDSEREAQRAAELDLLQAAGEVVKERDAVVKYLRQYILLSHAIKQKTDELAKLKGLSERITSVLTGLPRGKPRDTCESIATLIDLEKEIGQEIEKLVVVRCEIQEAIAMVEDERLQRILKYRYINGYRLEKIAVEMNYSYRNTKRLHQTALSKIKVGPQCPL